MLKIKHQKSDPAVPPISVSSLFDISCLGHLDDIVVDEKTLTFTRRELRRDRNMLAKAFLKLGIQPGDIITVANDLSIYDNIVIFFAANRIGAIPTFLDAKLSRDMLLKYLDEFHSPLLITYHATKPRIQRLKADAKSVKHIINLTSDFDHRNFNQTILETFIIGKVTAVEAARRYRDRLPLNIFTPNSEALISFTSGSTSGPKPMIFTNKALLASAIYSKTASDVKMWDKRLHSWMSYVRFYYPYGLVVSVLAPILGGGKVILTPDINSETLNYYLNKNPDTIFGVPPLLEEIPQKIKPETDISGLKMFASGGERLEKIASLEALDFFKSRGLKNIKISNGYGVGEALGLISTAVGNTAYNPDSVGKIPAGVHVMVVDPETNVELGFRKVGIICVHGKHILKSYYNRPEYDEEKIIIKDGKRFVRTGDLAYVSETGYITLAGRATHFINNIPEKVYYEIVRTAITKSDLVAKCYVVKGPDEKFRFAPYAFIVPCEGIPRTNETRKKILETAAQPFYLGRHRATLKDYELPQKIIFLDDLPHTRADKIDFRKLEHLAKEFGKPNKNS